MSQNSEFDLPDIINLEIQLQDKINELMRKSQALEDIQKELLIVRQQLLDKKIALEDSKKVINDLKMQLTTANQIIQSVEKDKSKYMNEKIQLEINCNAALKVRESLVEVAHIAKLENMTLKLNFLKLQETAEANELTKNALEFKLKEMQERFLQVNNVLQSNFAKLEKEHQYLRQSIQSTTQLNNRLKTVGLCMHAIYMKKDEEIKRLQEKLAGSAQQTRFFPSEILQQDNVDTRNDKLNTKALLEQIHLDIEKNEAADKEVETVLAEFENN